MNRKAILLIGLLTDFRGYLAAGQWLAPEMGCYFFVTQISQMTQIFFIDYLSPTDFTDSHRFFSFIIFLMDLHGFSLVFFFPCHFFFFLSFLYFADFRPVGLGRMTQIFYERFLPLKLLRTKADSQFLQRDSVAV